MIIILYGYFGGEMSKMSTRIKLISLSLLMAVLLTSCSKGELSNAFWKMVNETNIVLDFLTPDKEPEKTNAELVLQYIQEKNTDAIYDMLCKRLKKQPNVRKRIEETFDFIEGDVVSYETGYASGGMASTSTGKFRKAEYRDCSPIETTSGNTYQLVISYYDRNDFDLDLVGIYGITLIDNSKEKTDPNRELTIEVEI